MFQPSPLLASLPKQEDVGGKERTVLAQGQHILPWLTDSDRSIGSSDGVGPPSRRFSRSTNSQGGICIRDPGRGLSPRCRAAANNRGVTGQRWLDSYGTPGRRTSQVLFSAFRPLVGTRHSRGRCTEYACQEAKPRASSVAVNLSRAQPQPPENMHQAFPLSSPSHIPNIPSAIRLFVKAINA